MIKYTVEHSAVLIIVIKLLFVCLFCFASLFSCLQSYNETQILTYKGQRIGTHEKHCLGNIEGTGRSACDQELRVQT